MEEPNSSRDRFDDTPKHESPQNPDPERRQDSQAPRELLGPPALPVQTTDSSTHNTNNPSSDFGGEVKSEKEILLERIHGGLATGVITDADVEGLLYRPNKPAAAVIQDTSALESTPLPPVEKLGKLSAVEVMFNIAGIVLFASLMTTLGQGWDNMAGAMRIFLSFGIGILLWLVGYIFNRQKSSSDVRKGLENAVIVTGALSVWVGGFIITYELVGDMTDTSYIPVAITLLALAAINFLYDRFVRKDLILLLGIVLAVAAFPTFLMGQISQLQPIPDVYSLIFIASAGLLVYASRVAAKIQPDRAVLRHPFDGLAIFLVLATMFVSIFSDYGVIWTILLFMSVFGLFYLSIIKRNKNFLGNASFFLIVGVITMAFKYFSGAGVSVSLIVAALGLLGSAAFAASINRKYFKTAPPPSNQVA